MTTRPKFPYGSVCHRGSNPPEPDWERADLAMQAYDTLVRHFGDVQALGRGCWNTSWLIQRYHAMAGEL